MRGGGTNILTFRKVGHRAPLDTFLADNGAGRSCNRLDRPVSNSVPDLPCDTQPLAFHASESLRETLVRQGGDWIFWSGWLNGFAFGVLIVSTIALLWWPR